MKTTISLLALCLLGYVSAGDVDDSECAEFLKLKPSKDSDKALMKYKGAYQIASEMSAGQPIYRNEYDPTLCLYTDTEKMDVNLGECLTDKKMYEFYLQPTPENKTCFGPMINESFTVIDAKNNSVAGTVDLMAYDPLDMKCELCKDVLEGPMKGLYKLEDPMDERCEDGCLYSNKEGRVFCFEDSVGDRVRLGCPAYEGGSKPTKPATPPAF